MRVDILSDVAVSPNIFDGSGKCCSFCQSAQDANGAIFCAYRSGTAKHGPDGTFLFQRSSDGGKTWSAPATVFDRTDRTPPESVVCGGIAAVKGSLLAVFASLDMLNPAAYVFSEEAEKFPHYVSLCRSDDGGRTWPVPQRIDIAPYGGARTGIAANPFLLAGGDLCIPVETQMSCGPQGTISVVSSDKGHSFSKPRLLVGDETGKLCLCDARVARLSGGSFLMHLWTFTQEGEKTLNVHQSRSTDGLHWSTPKPTRIQGQISCPLELSPGKLIAVCNYREVPEGNHLWWSDDGGETWCDSPIQMWDVAASRVLGEPAQHAVPTGGKEIWESLPKFSFGTPSLQLMRDGAVLLIYYATVNGIIHVRACRFRVSG